MQFVNLTPHPVMVVRNGEVFLTVEKSGLTARLNEIVEPVGEIDGIQVSRKTFGAVTLSDGESFPAPVEDTTYIVSAMVAAELAGRKDVVFPDVLVRNSEGQIIGCAGFARRGAKSWISRIFSAVKSVFGIRR